MTPDVVHRRRVGRSRGHASHVFPEGGSWLSWVVKNRYMLTEAYAREADHDPYTGGDTRARLELAVAQANKWMIARLVVTILLSLGVVATAAAAVFAAVPGLSQMAGPVKGALTTIAGWAASLTVVLVVARLLIQRVLVRYDVSTLYLASRAAP